MEMSEWTRLGQMEAQVEILRRLCDKADKDRESLMGDKDGELSTALVRAIIGEARHDVDG